LYPVFDELVRIYPSWRGYEYFLVGDQIIVVNPRTLEIVIRRLCASGARRPSILRDTEHWGVFTIGTGLGNARFTNRKAADE
jgi:hypothetical protein